MKSKLYTLPAVLLASILFSLTACSLNTDDSGDLGGYWHLTGIDTLATVGYCDMSKAPIYWAVQGRILEARDVKKNEFVMFRYEHNGNTLSLTDARINQRELGDTLITDVTTLQPYGINNLEEVFTVEAISGSKMVLKSEMLRLYFKKF